MKTQHALILAAFFGLLSSARADIVDEYLFARNLNDSSGNGYNLTAGGTFQYVTGHDGAPNSAVQLITNNPANGTFFLGTGPNLANQSSSVSFWIRDDVLGGESWVFGLGHPAGTGGDTGQDMHISFGSGQALYSFFYNDLSVPFTLQQGQWYNVTGTFDYSTETMDEYINGILVASMVSPYPFSGGDSFKLGFQGSSLDDFRFYNSALSPDQVAQLAAVANVPDGGMTAMYLGLAVGVMVLGARRFKLAAQK